MPIRPVRTTNVGGTGKSGSSRHGQSSRPSHTRQWDLDLPRSTSSKRSRGAAFLTVVFVEVRYRKTTRYGSGAESVSATKRNRLIKSANHFLTASKLGNSRCRFDVISASDPDNLGIQIDWIKDAFEE